MSCCFFIIIYCLVIFICFQLYELYFIFFKIKTSSYNKVSSQLESKKALKLDKNSFLLYASIKKEMIIKISK